MLDLTPEYLEEHGFSPSIVERLYSKVFILTYDKGCHLWLGATSKGYGTIRPNESDNITYVHRIVWILHHGLIPDGLWVLHHCDTPLCCRVDHLWLGTAKDNKQDCVRKNRQAPCPFKPRFGEDHFLSKMTWDKVRDARSRHASGKSSIRELAEEHGVSFQTIYCIIRGKTWITQPTESPLSSKQIP